MFALTSAPFSISASPTLSWSFGGVLSAQPPAVAWVVVVAAAVLGLGLVWYSYQRALVRLPPSRRWGLIALRAALWLGLLLLLAAPTRVQRQYEPPPPSRPIAVLVDRSRSMTMPDNRHQRRIDDALRRWREMEPAARSARHELKSFVFADGLKPTNSVDRDVDLPPDHTRLFAALQQVIAAAPPGGLDSIVTLTDGLDNSGAAMLESDEAVARAATAHGTALHFVPGRNRYAGAAFLQLRDFDVPSQIAPKGSIPIEAVFDSYQAEPQSVPVELKVNGVATPAAALQLRAGRQLANWSTFVPAGESGVVELELRVGKEVARASVPVSRPLTNRILYFQGALDWSYRFLADILRHDSSFTLTPVFNFPNPSVVLPPGALRRMPEIPQELDRFDVVVLANASATQFTPQQQAALGAWVRDGGVVMFFTPDDDSTAGFAGSELEKMLPVQFSAAHLRRDRTADVLARFGGGHAAGADVNLSAFAWEQTPRVREIFAEAGDNRAALIAPLFSEYAHVAAAKPGAEVLARHPTDVAEGGTEHAILLAIQRYGTGQSAVLTTDALWRWRLHEPVQDHGPDYFWRTLFAWLTRQRESGLRFDQTPRVAESGHDLALRVVGGSGHIAIEATQGGKRLSLPDARIENGVSVFDWSPPTAGLWLFTAADQKGDLARHWITVRPEAGLQELSGVPPDEDLMRKLAARTGGEVLEHTAPASWQPIPQSERAVLGEKRDLLWQRGWVFAALLGVYGLELILRRLWRLLVRQESLAALVR